MSHLRTLIRIVLISLFLGIVIHVSPPFLGGVYYAGCGDRGMEQACLIESSMSFNANAYTRTPN